MSLKDFMLNVKSELIFMDESKQEMVKEYSPVLTNLSFFRVIDKPGFLTPWWEETSDDVTMGPLQAGRELAIKAGTNLLLVGSNILGVFTIPFVDGERYEHAKAERWLAALSGILYYSASFVVELVLSLVAIVMRTLASAALSVEAVFEALGC